MGAISFQTVKGLKPRKNTFDKSHMVAFPTTMGKLVPVMTDFIIPGSKVKMSSSLHTRMQALISPIMDNVNTYVHCWNVPIRLVDEKFKKFIGNEIDPEYYNPAFFTPKGLFQSLGDCSVMFQNSLSSDGVFADKILDLPYGYLSGGNYLSGEFASLLNDDSYFNSSLLQSLGYVGTSDWWENSEEVINLYEFKAYLLLLKTWYINENITISMPFYSEVVGVEFDFVSAIEDFFEREGNVEEMLSAMYMDFVFNFGLKAQFNHGWAKDYFTSALPNTQYGEPVTLPLATSAPVVGKIQIDDTAQLLDINVATGAQSSAGANVELGNSVAGAGYKYELNNSDGARISTINGRLSVQEVDVTQGNSELHADLSEATAISIIELRIAETLQVFKERLMRAGRRYREYLRMFFNVVSSDATLQDPQWLGGGRVALNVSDIPQMSATNEVSPQGNLAGKGMQFGQNFSGFTFYAEEWCVVICLAYMQPKARYSLGIDRNKMKTNNIYDWFNPTFEHVGEQPLYTAELYAGDVPKGDVFGYQRRYAEYTFKNDRMFGAFGNTLSHWTAGLRLFDNKPVLNQQFIYVQPETFDRIFALAESEGEGNVLMWFYHSYYVKQPVSKFGTPGIHI